MDRESIIAKKNCLSNFASFKQLLLYYQHDSSIFFYVTLLHLDSRKGRNLINLPEHSTKALDCERKPAATATFQLDNDGWPNGRIQLYHKLKKGRRVSRQNVGS